MFQGWVESRIYYFTWWEGEYRVFYLLDSQANDENHKDTWNLAVDSILETPV